MMLSSSKQRTKCTTASHSRILARNWLPRPAMSTNESDVGTVFADLLISASFLSRSSGTATMPVLGSMVQNGKLAACACDSCMSALKSVDLPTLGRPTMPVLSAIVAAWCRRGKKLLRGLMGATTGAVAPRVMAVESDRTRPHAAGAGEQQKEAAPIAHPAATAVHAAAALRTRSAV